MLHVTPSCRVTTAQCYMSNLRNSHVVMSNLVVYPMMIVPLGRTVVRVVL